MTRTILAAAVLALTPALAMAECGWHQKNAAMTCADGMVYDADADACVKVTG
ncbi:hypothetical protein P1J78_14955 [Psychromarinibacter sp. C21-152]|uniref:Adenylosuccinate lyase n=1 Tax=Psychromarinibacter sediminicola TaxID=3033385 RepID=A0AAE3NUT6_9RHOB|nr:hypothetical protein [Psychromarinibacter sediminicola]MDF0602039.1 hypothetical protein [Psychromarinibacter sediminicola]